MTEKEKKDFVWWHEYVIKEYPTLVREELRINRNMWLSGVRTKDD